MKFQNVYIKQDNGRYRPFGLRYGEDYLQDGIWYVRHGEHSFGITNVDHYLEGLFRIGDRQEPIDIPQLCSEQEYVDYILDSEAFKKLMSNGYSWIELISKVVALILEKNKEIKNKKEE